LAFFTYLKLIIFKFQKNSKILKKGSDSKP